MAYKAVENEEAIMIFLFGSGVELEQIQSDQFRVQGGLKQYIKAGGEILAFGMCLKSRNSEGSQSCPASNLDTLYQLVKESDKVLTF